MAGEIVQVRKPPVDAQFALHLPQEKGKCRWCGKPVNEPGRKVWHSACEEEFKIIVDPAYARFMLEKRDHGICCDCGEDWSQRYRFQKGQLYGDHTEVIWVSLWCLDHHVALWKVRHMPPLQRLEYFKLANMKTRCTPCHCGKTSKEAAESAHFDELAGEGRKPKPKKPWAKRPMRQEDRSRARDINDD